MIRFLAFVAIAVAGFPAAAGAQAAQTVRCSFDNGPARACRMTDVAGRGGVHRMTFVAGNQKATFVGRAQTGWWSGTLNGKPAMGYERNRGNVVFSSTDLQTVFAWWYPANEHGSY
ncbi:hypothetical protein AB2M62_14970 [Sphingomonas sp. MMS12-HWE2-04]|uniref:hypothetical protein n=1 Tax=Sphingomonas sp. MMS12-HWE2-04 TaxID=3234199 RepID=UPI00384FA06D